jgi:hypothetical protein
MPAAKNAATATITVALRISNLIDKLPQVKQQLETSLVIADEG